VLADFISRVCFLSLYFAIIYYVFIMECSYYYIFS
jgi:hypothetical protein